MTPQSPRPARRRRAARLVAGTATGALALGLAAVPGIAQAAPAPSGSFVVATDWLAGELEGNLIRGSYEDQSGNDVAYVDHGLSIDVGLADRLARRDAAADEVREALAPEIGGYVGTGSENYANAVAKAATFVTLTTAPGSGAARSYGRRDLVADLEARTDDTSGRIADQTDYTDYANGIGQVFAATALTLVDSDEAPAATSYLLRQQCPGGGFRLDLGDARCTDDTEASVDVTALAVQQLTEVALAPAQRARAADYLQDVQAADGSFADSGSGPNANSTGLAAYALGLEGRSASATRAADWVRGLQVRAPGVCSDADEGAVAFNAAAFRAQRRGGIGEGRDQFQRATAQGAGGLDFVSRPGRALAVSSPRRYVRAGTLQTIRVSHLARRDTVCVARGGTGVDRVAPGSGNVAVRMFSGYGTATRTFTVTDGFGRSEQTRIRALGRTRLDVRAPARRERGSTMRVVARGLAAGEPSRLVVRKGVVRTTTANSDGVAVFRGVRVLRPAGNRRYVVQGKFGRIRRGSDTVRVLP